MTTGTIPANLEAVRERIALAAERSSRNADAVTLITVTKSVQVERIREAIAAGATHLGENRVQEAQAKFAKPGTQIADGIGMDNLTLHMIGSLQRNKAHDAAALFDWIHSTDSSQLLAALDKASQDTRAGKPLPVLLQANLTGEPTKSGVGAGALSTLAAALAGCQNLVGAGLMTIARLGADEIELHNTFAKLRRLLDELRATHPGDWQHLSMGMSNDYEIAIQEGATMVRLGRAIFGERK